MADEIAHPSSARGRTGIAVDDHHPARFLGALDGKFEQIGTLPLSGVIACRAKFAELVPVLEVGRVEKQRLTLVSKYGNQYPLLLRRVPEHLGVTEIFRIDVDHRIARVVRPGSSAIIAIRS